MYQSKHGTVQTFSIVNCKDFGTVSMLQKYLWKLWSAFFLSVMFLTFLLVQIDKNPIIGHSQMQLMRHYFESLHAGRISMLVSNA